MKLIATDEQLAELAVDWDSLAGKAPFQSHAWASLWWKHYANSRRQLFVLAVMDQDGAVVAIAPWFVDDTAARGRTIRFLGSGEVCSDYLTLLCDPNCRRESIIAIADYLTSNRDWDLLNLEGILTDDPVLQELVAALSERGMVAHPLPRASCWQISLPPCWDEYVKSLKKSHRKRLRQLTRRMTDTGRANVHLARNAEEKRHAMRLLVDLHQRRWNSLGQPGCFASEPFDGFLHEIADHLFDRGQLELFWLELDGSPAAVEIAFTNDHTAFAYQSGVDPDRIADEPGHVLGMQMIRQAIEDGRTTYDWLRGDEPYKAYWGAAPLAAADVHIVPNRLAARLRHQAWATGRWANRLVKNGLEMAGIK